MELKKAKGITIAATCFSLLLLAMASGTGNDVFGIIGLVVGFATLIFWLIFGRCPHCGSHVGRGPGKYCKHCGKELEQ